MPLKSFFRGRSLRLATAQSPEPCPASLKSRRSRLLGTFSSPAGQESGNGIPARLYLTTPNLLRNLLGLLRAGFLLLPPPPLPPAGRAPARHGSWRIPAAPPGTLRRPSSCPLRTSSRPPSGRPWR